MLPQRRTLSGLAPTLPDTEFITNTLESGYKLLADQHMRTEAPSVQMVYPTWHRQSMSRVERGREKHQSVSTGSASLQCLPEL